MEDESIVARLLARDEDAISRIQQRYGSYLLSISTKLLSNRADAEECVNSALLAAWNSIPPHKPSNLKTYLGKLVREISISRLRMLRADKRDAGGEIASLEELEEIVGDSHFDEALSGELLAKRISRFLRDLPPFERNLFVRRYFYNDPIESLCRRYGYGQSKVKMTLKRTRDRLATILKKEGYIT